MRVNWKRQTMREFSMMEKIEVLTLTLVLLCTVSGFSQRLTFAQIDGWNSHDQSDLRNKELSDVFTSAEMRKNGTENISEESTQMTKTEEQRGERNTSERNPTRELVEKVKTVMERRGDGLTSQIETEMEENTERETTTAGSIEGLFVKKSDEGYTPEKFLTSSLLQEGRKRKIYSVPDTAEYVDTDKEVASKMRENGPSLDPASKTETHNESRRLTRTGKKWKIDHDHDAVIPEEANHNRIDVKVKRSDQIERLKQKMVEEEQEGELVAGISHQEKRRAAQTIKEIGDKEKGAKKSEDIAHAVYKELIEKEDQSMGKYRNVELMENYTKLTGKQNKASSPQPQLNKPSDKPQLGTAKTPSPRPVKNNKQSKNKTIKKSKEKRRKKNNKTQKPPKKKKEIFPPMQFPYFMDNYCPIECACYGRVVQCSDKGVDKVPYGIPYNSRYILLMNNYINSIQLDLLNQYDSMEFLVLSNNRLTDGSIEGAFEGVPALKRLYLDRNLLQRVPADLPASLEELRLDNNRLTVMSKAAWAWCPGLLVLSLSNNSLWNNSVPNGVLSPLGNLRTLNLDHNMLISVPLGLPLSIKELYLKGNLLESFGRGAFNGKSGLVVLDLSENRLTNKGLDRDSFLNTTFLESINLEGNRLKQVPQHLPLSVKTLNLEGNFISSIKKSAFRSLKKLEHLGLAWNKIFKVTTGAFRMLPVLHQLDLSHNTLKQVPRQLPKGLHSVALKHNKIRSVPRDAFCWGNNTLSGLVKVQLEHNIIDMAKLDAHAFRCLRGFQVVHFY
ncbi:uncharacterized protein LOC118454172 [Neolamprologus brichardi]|uniref:uncharacterized protein LOC118454172 n=1 Tax=Neolamprologus brichardi TaxID=32507 RepID=UPI00164396AA|nr:uncharacterized protein LOC118454172 [Neolamprologus brichardi]